MMAVDCVHNVSDDDCFKCMKHKKCWECPCAEYKHNRPKGTYRVPEGKTLIPVSKSDRPNQEVET